MKRNSTPCPKVTVREDDLLNTMSVEQKAMFKTFLLERYQIEEYYRKEDTNRSVTAAVLTPTLIATAYYIVSKLGSTPISFSLLLWSAAAFLVFAFIFSLAYMVTDHFSASDTGLRVVVYVGVFAAALLISARILHK